MIILIEGCDKTGKTTLKNDIAKLFPGFKHFKNPIKPPERDPVEIGRISGIYQGAYHLSKSIGPVVFDRGHITEVVYGHRRGYDALNYTRWYDLEKELKGHAVVIYMSAPPAVVQKRFEKDKEDFIDPGEIVGILNRYTEYFEECRLPVLKLSSLDSQDENMTKVINFLAKETNKWTLQK